MNYNKNRNLYEIIHASTTGARRRTRTNQVSNFLKKPRPPTIMIAETKRLFDLGHISTSDTCLFHLRHTGGGHETPQVQGSAHFGTRYKCDSPQWSPCFFQIPYACFTIWCLQ